MSSVWRQVVVTRLARASHSGVIGKKRVRDSFTRNGNRKLLDLVHWHDTHELLVPMKARERTRHGASTKLSVCVCVWGGGGGEEGVGRVTHRQSHQNRFGPR
jgi:hypothetical protein